jgi:hypothetical protein
MTTFQSPQNGGTSGNTDNERFGQRVDQIGVDAQQLWSDARSAVTGLSETLDIRGRVDRNPYGMVLAAVGVGYVLGGGLFTPLTGRILKLGVRLAALPFVKDELLGMAEAALQGYQTGQARVSGQGPSAASGAAPRNPGSGTIS